MQAGDGHAAPLAQEKGMGAELPTPSIISRAPDCHTYEGMGVGVLLLDNFLKEKV